MRMSTKQKQTPDPENKPVVVKEGGEGRMERELGISKLMYIICRMDRQVLIYALVYTICSISDLLHSVQQTVSLAWCSVMT